MATAAVETNRPNIFLQQTQGRGRRPNTPESKQCFKCEGDLRPNVDKSGNTVDECVKCGQQHTPRGARSTSASTDAPRVRKARKPRQVKATKREPDAAPSLATKGILRQLRDELAAIDKRRGQIAKAIEALESL